MTGRPTLVLVFALLAMLGGRAAPATAGDRNQSDRIPWSTVPEGERRMVLELLEAPDWPFRVFGLLRLDRYAEIEPLLRPRLQDDAWQVRCFAIHQAARSGLEIAPETLADEKSPQVVRTALRHGVRLPAEFIEPGVKRLLRTRGLDELMLGVEIAAASDLEPVRAEALKRVRMLIRNMDERVAVLVSRRLAAIFRLDAPPAGAAQWRAWLEQRGGDLVLPPPSAPGPATFGPRSLTAELEADSLSQLLVYLRGLRRRDLDLVIVMDATMSMMPMINEARAGVDGLLVFFNDLSRSLRLAFVAYRDHDNPPVWEGQRFTRDVDAIRDFLFGLEISGGADYPEAVLEGVAACEKLDWNRRAARQIIVVGDAPPHEDDVYKLMALIESLRNHDVTLHAVHVPMRRAPDLTRRLSRTAAEQDRRWIEHYNIETQRVFGQMAETGGGRLARLDGADELVPAVMHFTLEESWWPVFDEFYAMYLELCR